MSIKKKRKSAVDAAASELLKGMASTSLRSISMRHALTETDKGTLEGEPKAKSLRELMGDAIADTASVPAVLESVGKSEACWTLKRSRTIETFEKVKIAPGWSDDLYEAADKEEFDHWSRLALRTLEESGRDPGKLKIPGMLCLSASGKVVFGWEEQADHPDALLLSIGEIMVS